MRRGSFSDPWALAQERERQAQEAAAHASPGKKGLLSRVAGIFRRKH